MGKTALTKVKTTSLSQQVTDRLVEYIRQERLQPGANLPSQQQLAETFGVSRPIVREALKSLAATGFIEITNGRTATVREISGDILKNFFHRTVEMGGALELIEVRRGIEIQSAKLAAQRRTFAELSAMRGIIVRMREQYRQAESLADLDVALHLHIASASHNAVMYFLVESIRDALKDSVLEGLRQRRSDEEFRAVLERHERLVDAIEAGDFEQAGKAMDSHFDVAVQLITKAPKT